MIALINAARMGSMKISLEWIKRNKSLKYKADRENTFLTHPLINTLLIISIFILMLYSIPEPNMEIVASVV